jgi:hypothetical protein
MADTTQFVEHDSDIDSESNSAYPVYHHKPPFQTRAGTLANASTYSEYDSDSEDLVTTITSHNSWQVNTICYWNTNNFSNFI